MIIPKSIIKYACLVFTLSIILLPHNTDAQNKKKKKKKNETEVIAKPIKKVKEKTIKDLTKSSKKIEGLFTVYQDTITGTMQMVVTEDQLNKEYIHFAQIADGVLDAGRYRGSYRGSKVFKIDT